MEKNYINIYKIIRVCKRKIWVEDMQLLYLAVVMLGMLLGVCVCKLIVLFGGVL